MFGYLHYSKNGFMDNVVHRVNVFFGLGSNIIYMIITYYLWKAIFNGQDMINGMTFNQTMVYLIIANAINALFVTYTEDYMSCKVMYGSLIVDIVKPVDFQVQVFFRNIGVIIFNFFIITVPITILGILGFNLKFDLGLNLIFFIISLINAAAISLFIDFLVGLVAFYTESIWSIVTIKDVLITTLSGICIPIMFFPKAIQDILNYLPFQAIYNIPLVILNDSSIFYGSMMLLLLKQFIWIIFLLLVSRIALKRAFKTVMINGG